jgi:hypothetical protein
MLAFCAGDGSAFEALFGRWAAPLLRYLERMLRDAAGAEELVQEVFLRVHGHASVTSPRRAFDLVTGSRRTSRSTSCGAARRRERHGEPGGAGRPRWRRRGLEWRRRARCARLGARRARAGAASERQRAALCLTAVEGLRTRRWPRRSRSRRAPKALVHRARTALPTDRGREQPWLTLRPAVTFEADLSALLDGELSAERAAELRAFATARRRGRLASRAVDAALAGAPALRPLRARPGRPARLELVPPDRAASRRGREARPCGARGRAVWRPGRGAAGSRVYLAARPARARVAGGRAFPRAEIARPAVSPSRGAAAGGELRRVGAPGLLTRLQAPRRRSTSRRLPEEDPALALEIETRSRTRRDREPRAARARAAAESASCPALRAPACCASLAWAAAAGAGRAPRLAGVAQGGWEPARARSATERRRAPREPRPEQRRDARAAMRERWQASRRESARSGASACGAFLPPPEAGECAAGRACADARRRQRLAELPPGRAAAARRWPASGRFACRAAAAARPLASCASPEQRARLQANRERWQSLACWSANACAGLAAAARAPARSARRARAALAETRRRSRLSPRMHADLMHDTKERQQALDAHRRRAGDRAALGRPRGPLPRDGAAPTAALIVNETDDPNIGSDLIQALSARHPSTRAGCTTASTTTPTRTSRRRCWGPRSCSRCARASWCSAPGSA